MAWIEAEYNNPNMELDDKDPCWLEYKLSHLRGQHQRGVAVVLVVLEVGSCSFSVCTAAIVYQFQK
jgi:hypothetical protein